MLTRLKICATVFFSFLFFLASSLSEAADQIKTVDFYVFDAIGALSTSTSQDFSVYIGDNLSGVANPVKSAYFSVSGVYTGNGTVTLTLNGTSSQAFTMPSVASPTYFELLYKDSSGIINPSSAGSYTYNFGINPSGVTIYGTGAQLYLSHRYVPPACGGLPATGELVSVVFDSSGSDVVRPTYNSFMWKGSLNGGTGRVRFQLATSDSPSGPWNFYGSSDNGVTCSSGAWYDAGAQAAPVEIFCAGQHHNNQRYFKYKVQLCSNSDCTSSGSISPQVNDIIVNWSP